MLRLLNYCEYKCQGVLSIKQIKKNFFIKQQIIPTLTSKIKLINDINNRYLSTTTTINNSYFYEDKNNNNQRFPTHSQIVIAGAGILANSVAYHLVINGWNDVLVLEQNGIGSGTSNFGSGTLGLFKPVAHRKMISYSLELYKKLQQQGYDIGFKQCGSINLAQTKDRMIALQRRVAYNKAAGLYCELLEKNKLKNLYENIYTDDIEGAVWVPDDAIVNPKSVCMTLANIAKNGGVNYIENCYIKKINTNNDDKSVKSIDTNFGNVTCEYFVNCAGMWARDLGLKCNPKVNIPAYPAQHFYAITSSLPSYLSNNLPIIRDYDAHSYVREWSGELMAGWFELEAKPAFENLNIPNGDWARHLIIEKSHWIPLWNKIKHRFPILNKLNEPTVINCPDNFTPDGRWILGETAEVKNYFVAVGMNGNSVQGAGGIGKAVAEWLINGESTQELLPFNIQRFLELHNNKNYLQQRIKEVVGRNYGILYPHQCEYKYGRKLRCSPLYSVLENHGAVFGIKMAYERPLYFDSTYKIGNKKPIMPAGSYYKPKFFDFMKEEFQACREGVGIIDMSSFCKIEIKSINNEVVNYLQNLSSNDVNIPIGSITHTGMQNEHGGYENDCMLVRKNINSYFMVSPTLQQTRIYQWMSKHLPNDHSVWLNDLTSYYTVINVVGPKGPQLLAELTNSNINLQPFSYKIMNIAYASDVMVMSFTHTGEPGYCLYIPTEYALHVYSKLIEIGRDYGVRDVGILTQRFMRIERFIPFWAEELTPFVTPFETGFGHSVDLQKNFFIGKNSLIKQKLNGVTKRLVLFIINELDVNKDVWAWGGEPIYRNNEFVGTLTSCGYGFTVDKLVGLGFISRPETKNHKYSMKIKVTTDYIMDPSAIYHIDIAGRLFPVTPHVLAPTALAVKNNNKKYVPTPVMT